MIGLSREPFPRAISDDLAFITSSRSELCKEVKSRSQVKSAEYCQPLENQMRNIKNFAAGAQISVLIGVFIASAARKTLKEGLDTRSSELMLQLRLALSQLVLKSHKFKKILNMIL